MSEYPEHDKLLAVKAKTQAIGEFVDWMAERHRARFMQFRCGHWVDAPGYLDQWLAEWAGIDRSTLAAEKVDMLEKIRMMNEEGDDARSDAIDV